MINLELVKVGLGFLVAAVFACVLFTMTNCGDLEYVPVIIPGPVLKCPINDSNASVKCPDVECPVCPQIEDLLDENCSAFPGNGYGWQKER